MFILNRPLEILILVGLSAVIGVILFQNGMATGGLEFPTAIPSMSNGIPGLVGSIMGILGGLELPIALAFFGSAAGLFLGKRWGWSLSRKMQVIGIIFGFGFLYDAGGEMMTMGLYTLAMALSGVVIGYLHAPEVKEFYGQNVVQEAPRRQRRRRKQVDEEEEMDVQESSASEVE